VVRDGVAWSGVGWGGVWESGPGWGTAVALAGVVVHVMAP
jgi:hypothetical protein